MFWLGASAFFMILTCIGHVWLITILTTTGYNNVGSYAQEYFGVWFLLSASRILVAASQLLAVSPESALRRHIASLYGSMPVPVFSPFTSTGQEGAQGLEQVQVGVLPGSSIVIPTEQSSLVFDNVSQADSEGSTRGCDNTPSTGPMGPDSDMERKPKLDKTSRSELVAKKDQREMNKRVLKETLDW